MVKNILFDLDGTLTDPALGITSSVAYALSKFGIEVADRSSLHPFIGPPLLDAFSEYYGFSSADAERAVAYYREYFSVDGMYQNTVYEGIPEMLAALRESGFRLYVATSKPERFALPILRHFSLFDFFDGVYGATLDPSRASKDKVIAYALAASKLSPDETVMVGDRRHDIDGARANSLLSVGVLYGYGDRAELTAAGADYIAESIPQLLNILKGLK